MRSLSATLFILFLTVVVCGVTAVRLSDGNLHRLFGVPATTTGQPLYSFDPFAAKRLRFDGNDVRADAVLENDQWILTQPWNDRMDPRLARAIIQFTIGTRVVDAIPQDKIESAQNNFFDGTTDIRIGTGTGDALAKYRLGRRTAFIHHDETTGSETPTVFIQPRDKNRKDYTYACTGDIHDAFKDGFRLLRDHRPFYFNPAYLESVRIRNREGEIQLARLPDRPVWRIVKPLELQTDPNAVLQLFQALEKLEAKRLYDRSEVTLPQLPEGSADLYAIKLIGQPQEIVLTLYPPAKPEAETVYATVSDRPNTVFELLRKPAATSPSPGRSELVSLASFPSTINELRRQTLTSLNPGDLAAIDITPLYGEPIHLARPEGKLWKRLTPQGDALPINEIALAHLLQTLISRNVDGFISDAAADLAAYGLDRPAVSLRFRARNDESFTLRFAQNRSGVWCAMREGTPTVVRVDPSFIAAIPVHPWQWRTSTLWSLSPFDISGVERRQPGQPPILLKSLPGDRWEASVGSENQTLELRPDRASRLLRSLAELTVSEWLNPADEEARKALETPSLTFTLFVRQISPAGESIGFSQRVLRIAPVPGLTPARRFYAVTNLESQPFILTSDQLRLLQVDLFSDN